MVLPRQVDVSELPFANLKKHVPRMKGMCPICGKMNPGFTCGCGGAVYCSEEHRLMDWTFHSKTCRTVIVDVKNDETTTTLFCAAKAIQENTVILYTDPIIISPWVSPGIGKIQKPEFKLCLACCLWTQNDYQCPKCSWPVCSDECANNPLHSMNECDVFAHMTLKPSDRCGSIMLKGILAIRCLLLSKYFPEIYDQILQRMPEFDSLELTAEAKKDQAIEVRFVYDTCRISNHLPVQLDRKDLPRFVNTIHSISLFKPEFQRCMIENDGDVEHRYKSAIYVIPPRIKFGLNGSPNVTWDINTRINGDGTGIIFRTNCTVNCSDAFTVAGNDIQEWGTSICHQFQLLDTGLDKELLAKWIHSKLNGHNTTYFPNSKCGLFQSSKHPLLLKCSEYACGKEESIFTYFRRMNPDLTSVHKSMTVLTYEKMEQYVEELIPDHPFHLTHLLVFKMGEEFLRTMKMRMKQMTSAQDISLKDYNICIQIIQKRLDIGIQYNSGITKCRGQLFYDLQEIWMYRNLQILSHWIEIESKRRLQDRQAPLDELKLAELYKAQLNSFYYFQFAAEGTEEFDKGQALAVRLHEYRKCVLPILFYGSNPIGLQEAIQIFNYFQKYAKIQPLKQKLSIKEC